MQIFGKALEVIMKVKVRFLLATAKICLEQFKISIIKISWIWKESNHRTLTQWMLVEKLKMGFYLHQKKLNLSLGSTSICIQTDRTNWHMIRKIVTYFEHIKNKIMENNLDTNLKLWENQISFSKTSVIVLWDPKDSLLFELSKD